MTQIFIPYRRHEHTTRERDETDSWDRGDSAASIYMGNAIFTSDDSYKDGQWIEVPISFVPGRKYFLLWADYNTGDSFGTSHNQIEIIDIFRYRREADRWRLHLLRDSSRHSETYRRADGSPSSLYKPWSGYFESLNDLNIEEVTFEG